MRAFILQYAVYGLGGIILALAIYAGIKTLDAAHWHKLYDAQVAARKLDTAKTETASAQATVNNITDVRAKEGDGAKLVEDKQHDLEAQLADARRLAADYARRMRAASAADPGSAGEGSLSPATSAPSGPVSAGMSVIPDDDLRICVENTVRVKGWQDFYSSLRTRYNTDGAP